MSHLQIMEKGIMTRQTLMSHVVRISDCCLQLNVVVCMYDIITSDGVSERAQRTYNIPTKIIILVVFTVLLKYFHTENENAGLCIIIV